MNKNNHDKVTIKDEPEGFFMCEHCGKLCPDEDCFGVVQVDDDPIHAELWCIECGVILVKVQAEEKKQE